MIFFAVSFPNAYPAAVTYAFKKQLRGRISLDDVSRCVPKERARAEKSEKRAHDSNTDVSLHAFHYVVGCCCGRHSGEGVGGSYGGGRRIRRAIVFVQAGKSLLNTLKIT